MHKCILVPNHGAAAGGDTMTALMPRSCPVTAGWPAEPPPPSDRPITLTLVTFGGVRTAPCGGLHYPVCESLFYSVDGLFLHDWFVERGTDSVASSAAHVNPPQDFGR